LFVAQSVLRAPPSVVSCAATLRLATGGADEPAYYSRGRSRLRRHYTRRSPEKNPPQADDRPRAVRDALGMSAAEIRVRLCDLQLERLEAESCGLAGNRAYMERLESERADCQRALIAAALDEVLALRSELSWRQYG
jgi:hypothetical protein